VGKPMGAVSVFMTGNYARQPLKAAFRDISTTRFTPMGDSPGHPPKRVRPITQRKGTKNPSPTSKTPTLDVLSRKSRKIFLK